MICSARTALLALLVASGSSAFLTPSYVTFRGGSRSSIDALGMVRARGLEKAVEYAAPAEGDMHLYVKAGPDGESLGDCPFAHFVRCVLHEKNMEYTLLPTTQETKPRWLVEYYGGTMPALEHGRECYTESDLIAQYLEFFFPDPPLSINKKAPTEEAEKAVEGFFPAVAKYLKHTPDGDEDDLVLKGDLEESLKRLETHLGKEGHTGPYLVGDGDVFTLQDCSVGPKLYHMKVGLKAFKSNAIDVEKDFPLVYKYMENVFARKSFVDAIYPEETVIWGWTNARS